MVCYSLYPPLFVAGIEAEDITDTGEDLQPRKYEFMKLTKEIYFLFIHRTIQKVEGGLSSQTK